MKESVGGGGQVTERVELKEKDVYQSMLSDINVYKFSFYLPKNFPQKKVRLVIGQWKQEGDHSPLLAQRYVDGIFYITISNPSGKKTILKLNKKQSDSLLGRWIDVEYRTKFALKEGFVSLKVDNFKAEYKGPLGFPDDDKNIYFKFGLYRDQFKESMTVFFDRYYHSRNSSN